MPCNAVVGRNSPGESDAPDVAYGAGSGHSGRPGRHRRGPVHGTAERRSAGQKTRHGERSGREAARGIEKIGPPARTWQRSTAVRTTWGFTSKRDPSAYSQGLPLLFPRYEAPVDGNKTVPAANGQGIGLSVTGHAGYAPGALESAKLSYSYSYDGENWTAAKAAERGGRWTAAVDHVGASGKPVSLKVELTDANGVSVTQTVTRAYDVR
ncbi:hypothetical protein [Streptomyces antarcticus]|uniref:hypothetical protein n=1 Tax=Streptomyces antarcticus TaxID=2996458 RepID=UPI002D1E465C|nr:hypothetical protein [Streptomyces sp. H34-AA3]